MNLLLEIVMMVMVLGAVGCQDTTYEIRCEENEESKCRICYQGDIGHYSSFYNCSKSVCEGEDNLNMKN